MIKGVFVMNKNRRTDVYSRFNIIYSSRSYPKKSPNSFHHNIQQDLFPGEYWAHLNFVQRALLVDHINTATNKQFIGYLDTWDALPQYFRDAVIDYLENEEKPIEFYYRQGGAI
jgi:hypothetical protein